jgi:hypothetical protein
LLVAALIPQWAAAQVSYKSTMPDGKVIYGDKPVPGAAKTEQLKAAPTQGITPPSDKERGVLQNLESSREARESKDQRLRAAEEAVKGAEAALAAGKEPRPGEHIGTAGGGQRLTEAYFERQKQLEVDVERARAALSAARAR